MSPGPSTTARSLWAPSSRPRSSSDRCRHSGSPAAMSAGVRRIVFGPRRYPVDAGSRPSCSPHIRAQNGSSASEPDVQRVIGVAGLVRPELDSVRCRHRVRVDHQRHRAPDSSVAGTTACLSLNVWAAGRHSTTARGPFDERTFVSDGPATDEGPALATCPSSAHRSYGTLPLRALFDRPAAPRHRRGRASPRLSQAEPCWGGE